ncbi:MAG: hypothetical protein IPN48_09195 [Sphingomonadales bacterium]|nr:hypothetical protein [Sphingomonadales bacterium]
MRAPGSPALNLVFQDYFHMRYLFIGAIAPAALMAATPADARPSRVDIPIQIDPNSSVYVLWVKVKAEGDHTIVSGYVREKRWFVRSRGHLHIAFLRQGQQIACQESDWKKYRRRSRGQWRFTSSVQIAASTIDSVQISHVDHDRVPDSTPRSMKACSGSTVDTEQNAGGA